MQNIARKGDVALTPFRVDQWQQFFNRYDRNGDGRIPITDFIAALRAEGRNVPPKIIRGLQKRIQMADTNQDQIITFDEFTEMIQSKEGSKYGKYFQKYIHYTVASRARYDTTDGEYEDEYSCSPPKLCMAIFSIIELITFIYDWVYYDGAPRYGSLGEILIYDPSRRKEAWRYVTYMFVHMGTAHLVVNLSVQILLGVPLEMVHGNWRVFCIYISGVLAGSLGTSISDPTVFLAGASGGVYALMTAHISTIIMNWTEMKFALYQLFVFGCLIIVDVGQALYGRYSGDPAASRIGYVAHFAGAVTGLLVGINVLRNLRVKRWENYVWWASLVLFSCLMLSAITINVAFPSYFPPQKV
ncbi:Rhomboid family [Nesidiocoris tenuis]|uniref:Rhomboid family n=1 Tax=Nesidiocoris tenuis TaxID=355587 RepID=A0ABN7AD77_9HEMI|nr:Rhomboid family [Nesidiocoris tenuis]